MANSSQEEQAYKDLAESGGIAGSPDAPIPIFDVGANGPVNAFGEHMPSAEYVVLTVERLGRFRISVGAAEVLAFELMGAVDRHNSSNG